MEHSLNMLDIFRANAEDKSPVHQWHKPANLLVNPVEQTLSSAAIINNKYLAFILFRFPTARDKLYRRTPKEHWIVRNRELVTEVGIRLRCQGSH